MEKGRDTLDVRILKLFKKMAVKGFVMLTIPDVAKGLNIDRRKIETELALLSKGKDPKLLEVTKGRVKYYALKEVVEFCQKWRSEK